MAQDRTCNADSVTWWTMLRPPAAIGALRMSWVRGSPRGCSAVLGQKSGKPCQVRQPAMIGGRKRQRCVCVCVCVCAGVCVCVCVCVCVRPAALNMMTEKTHGNVHSNGSRALHFDDATGPAQFRLTFLRVERRNCHVSGERLKGALLKG